MPMQLPVMMDEGKQLTKLSFGYTFVHRNTQAKMDEINRNEVI